MWKRKGWWTLGNSRIAATAAIFECCIERSELEGTDTVNVPLAVAGELADYAADPDLVHICRCGNCIHWEPETVEEGDSCGHCRDKYGPCYNQQTDMNWFCANGEREG